MLDCQFCIHASKGAVIIRNQLKYIYNSPFKDSLSHPINTCFLIIASNAVRVELLGVYWKVCLELTLTITCKIILWNLHWKKFLADISCQSFCCFVFILKWHLFKFYLGKLKRHEELLLYKYRQFSCLKLHKDTLWKRSRVYFVISSGALSQWE